MDELEEIGIDPDVANLIAFLDELRQKLGISQTELAERMGSSQGWVSELFSGAILNPRASSLARMARALDMRLNLQVSVRGDAKVRQHARVALDVARELRERGIDVSVRRTV